MIYLRAYYQYNTYSIQYNSFKATIPCQYVISTLMMLQKLERDFLLGVYKNRSGNVFFTFRNFVIFLKSWTRALWKGWNQQGWVWYAMLQQFDLHDNKYSMVSHSVLFNTSIVFVTQIFKRIKYLHKMCKDFKLNKGAKKQVFCQF